MDAILPSIVRPGALAGRLGFIIRVEHLPAPGVPRGSGASSPVDAIQAALEAWALDACDRPDASGGAPELFKRYLGLVEPPLLKAVLARNGNNRAAAAQLMGLHRATLRQKMRRHDLT